MVLPRFRYRAVMANGVMENEICPVTTALTLDDPRVDPAEVAATTWVPWSAFRDDVLTSRRDVSSWCHEQVHQLAPLGDDPLSWPARSLDELHPPPWSADSPPHRSGSRAGRCSPIARGLRGSGWFDARRPRDRPDGVRSST